jgi:hypothetical protein
MNIYKELNEIEDLKENSKNQKDDILDHYFKDPVKAKKLLLELEEIEKELDDLEVEFNKILNEIH